MSNEQKRQAKELSKWAKRLGSVALATGALLASSSAKADPLGLFSKARHEIASVADSVQTGRPKPLILSAAQALTDLLARGHASHSSHASHASHVSHQSGAATNVPPTAASAPGSTRSAGQSADADKQACEVSADLATRRRLL